MAAIQRACFEKPIHLAPVGEYHNANYLNLFKLTGQLFMDAYTNRKSLFDLSQFESDLKVLVAQYNPNWLLQFLMVIVGGYVFVRIRQWMSKHVTDYLHKRKLLLETDFTPFMEGFFSLTVFVTTFCLTLSIEAESGYFTHPERMWSSFSLSNPIGFKVQLLFFLEASYYVHFIFNSTALVEHFRAFDFFLLVWHHIIVKALILAWYWSRTISFGIQFWLLIEFCGLFLTSFKCLLKLQFKDENIIRKIRGSTSAILLAVWFPIRMYFLPLRVIYPLALYMKYNRVDSWLPFTFANFVQLWILIAMNVYWSALMLRGLYRVIKGGYKEIGDEREGNKKEN